MGDVYLVEADDWLRDAGLHVIEYDGWKTRAKSSGGYTDRSRPWGVMWHHTASNSDAEDDAYYQCYVSDSRPISNATIDRNGDVWLLAAGPTNTNGKGSKVTWSKGKVPTDSMNSYAWGMEICNNGVGGTYPQAQIDSAFKVSNTINAHLGNRPDDVALHWNWAPDRKVDPAKASAVQGPWKPRSCTSSGTWEVADLKAECLARAAPQPPEPPPSGEDEMLLYVEVDDAWARFVATGQIEPELVLWQVGYVNNEGGNPRADVYSRTLRHVTVSKAQLSGCSLMGNPPPEDDGGGPARWNVSDFYEHFPRAGSHSVT